MNSFLYPLYKIRKEQGDGNFSFFISQDQEEVAHITCFIFKKKNLVYIHSLQSNKPGEHLGSFLISKMCEHVFLTYPQIQWVELDDSTGVNPPRNIYYKLGFKVRDENNYRFISWDTWLSRYSKTKNNPSEERRINLYSLNLNVQRYLFA